MKNKKLLTIKSLLLRTLRISNGGILKIVICLYFFLTPHIIVICLYFFSRANNLQKLCLQEHNITLIVGTNIPSNCSKEKFLAEVCTFLDVYVHFVTNDNFAVIEIIVMQKSWLSTQKNQWHGTQFPLSFTFLRKKVLFVSAL